jgi:tRNA pseudouridine55 synthase
MSEGARPPLPSQAHGLLVLDKPSGPTSTRCIETIKRRLGQRKIGHAGTLDPLAGGVLLVLLGQGTKVASYLLEGGDKVYLGRCRLGLTTDTYDIQGAVLTETECTATPDEVAAEVSAWLGLTEQEVPAYSAAKHEGTPLYALARQGKEAPTKVKGITISQAEVVDIDLPWVRFRVRCSSGTYVRSLVHSLGSRLGCGAVLTDLTREHSHPFGLEQAHSLDALLAEPEAFASKVLPIAAALPGWPRLRLTREQELLVRNGTWLDAEELGPGEARPRDGRPRWAILRGLWQS